MTTYVKVKSEIRREQITEAVLTIIAKHGLKGITTSAIAENVGISEANLYRHFANKDEILNSTVEKIGRQLQRNMEAVQQSPSKNVILKLRNLYGLHLKYIEQHAGVPRLVFSDEMHIGNNKLREKLTKGINVYAKALALLVKEGQKNGMIDKKANPKAVAFTIIGMIQVSTLKWSLNNLSFSLFQEGMKLWKNFERSLSS